MVTRIYYCVTLTPSVILLPLNVTLQSSLGQAPVSRRAHPRTAPAWSPAFRRLGIFTTLCRVNAELRTKHLPASWEERGCVLSHRAGRNLSTTLLAGFCGLLLAAGISRAESFSNFEAVDANGVSTWNGSYPVTLVGVLLTDPSEMLDATPDYLPWDDGANAFNLGGQWQVFVQAVVGGSDRGGVECWMAQNYGNLPWEPHDGSDSYTITPGLPMSIV